MSNNGEVTVTNGQCPKAPTVCHPGPVVGPTLVEDPPAEAAIPADMMTQLRYCHAGGGGRAHITAQLAPQSQAGQEHKLGTAVVSKVNVRIDCLNPNCLKSCLISVN